MICFEKRLFSILGQVKRVEKFDIVSTVESSTVLAFVTYILFLGANNAFLR
jgi:hypothetical protein